MNQSLVLKAVLFSGMLITGLATTANAGGDATAGQAKSATCAGCHGADGNSFAPNFPNLAGQHENYLLKQLQEFKSGARKDSTNMMQGMVAGLSEQDMADISAYFSSQKIKTGTTDKKYLLAGEQLFRAGDAATNTPGCIGCHGPNGMGNAAAKFPAVAGQQTAYTSKQLKDFRTGARNNDAGRMMQDVTTRLTDADIEALASYIAGLQ